MTRTTISTDLEALRGHLRVMLFLVVAITLRSAELNQPPPLAKHNAAQVQSAPTEAELRIINE